MKLEDRMRQSIRRRAGNVVFRADVAGLGCPSQVTHALGVLQSKGELLRIGSGIYVKATRDAKTDRIHPLADFESLARETAQKLGVAWQPQILKTPESLGVPTEFVVETGERRISRRLSLNGQIVAFVSGHGRSATGSGKSARRQLKIPTSGVARFVQGLARQFKVAYVPNSMDRWADTVTRLAGDEVHADNTQDLLVALKRSGRLSIDEMTLLMINHLREQKQSVRSI
ncbi:hypothetical protein FACS1894158_08700 [Betaproteobacteria bacterium]|nr:hypothetical protein FACS1894158_08700 [Betaproteobacteria bacterium]